MNIPFLTKTKETVETPRVIDVVRDYVNQLPENVVDDHIAKLNKVKTGGYGGRAGALRPSLKADLIANDFRFFVPMDIVTRFKYHASVCSPIGSMVMQGGITSNAIVYAGDIPDTALDRMIKVKELGIRFITVHSMQPFPIQLVQCDPVAIGWYEPMWIFKDGKETILRLLYNYSGTLEGVIVAIWDGQKEVSVL